MTNYIMLGAGYISGRHLDAIKDTGGNLLAYHDISDVVGHVDSRFINALYYPEFIHFDCFVDRQQKTSNPIDYAVILLPNHLHNPACRWAMNHGMDVICEKPVVLQERNLDELMEVEHATGKRVSTILQMRLHDSANKMRADRSRNVFAVNIDYATPRGPWFQHGSWKADKAKSGGLTTSIGIHLFDLCCYVFGNWTHWMIYNEDDNKVFGSAEFETASCEWSLSTDPISPARRVFNVNGVDHDFTQGFDSLHKNSYDQILGGSGFSLEDCRQSIRLVEAMRDVSCLTTYL